MKHVTWLAAAIVVGGLALSAGRETAAAQDAATSVPATGRGGPAMDDWPGGLDELSFLWANGKKPGQLQPAGRPRPYSCLLTCQGHTWLGCNYEMECGGGMFLTSEPPNETFLDRVKKTGRLSLELRLRSAGTQGGAPGYALSLNEEKQPPNLALAQEGDRLFLQFQRPGGKPLRSELGKTSPGRWQHVLVCCDAGRAKDRLVCYIDGRQAAVSDAVPENFTAWKQQYLGFGNDWALGHPWLGQIEGVSVGHRWLDAAAALSQCERSKQAFSQDRRSPPTCTIEGKLVARAEDNENAATVYAQSLYTYTYEVTRVLSGQCPHKRVSVFRLAREDYKMVKGIYGAETGSAHTLDLIPWNDCRGLETVYRVESAALGDAPLFFDQGRRAAGPPRPTTRSAGAAPAVAGGPAKTVEPPRSASRPAGAIDLGGKQVPKERFLVFFVWGDSNTQGSGGTNPDLWRSPRLWAYDSKENRWMPGQPGTPLTRGAVPAGSAGRMEKHWRGHGGHTLMFPMLKKLVEANPDYYYGLVNFACPGATGAGADVGVLEVLGPYIGQFTVGGFFFEGGPADSQIVAGLCKGLGVDVKDVPVVCSPHRIDRFDGSTETRLTPESSPELMAVDPKSGKRVWRGIPNWGQGVEKYVLGLQKGAIISTEGLLYRDNRHTWFTGGLDLMGERAGFTFLARGWAAPGAKPDAEKPTTPADVKVLSTWETGAVVAWTAARDNLAVAGYDVLVDGKKQPFFPTMSGSAQPSTVSTRFPISELAPDTTHAVAVQAIDYAGNRSSPSAALKVQTTAAPVCPALPLKINIGGPAVGNWVADKEFRDGGGYGRLLSAGVYWASPAPGSATDTQVDQAERLKRKQVFPNEQSAEHKVFSTARISPSPYKVSVPDGSYKVTWFIKSLDARAGKLDPKTWQEDVRDPFAVQVAPIAWLLQPR